MLVDLLICLPRELGAGMATYQHGTQFEGFDSLDKNSSVSAPFYGRWNLFRLSLVLHVLCSLAVYLKCRFGN